MRRFSGQGFLVVYSGLLTAVVTVLFTGGFTSTEDARPRFDTLTVQRINIVEPDGTLRMVLSNNTRIPNIIVHGKEYPDFNGRHASTAAGILFYDAQATESGGLTFGGRKDANGTITRFGHLSFDRYDQDQMLSIDAVDDGTNHEASIRLIDQPNWPIQELLDLLERIQSLPPDQQQAEIARFLETHPLGSVRALLTNDQNPATPAASRTALSFIDPSRRERARLGVIGATTDPALEFVNENGDVTHKYPPLQQQSSAPQRR
jgi:hypothetical protein